MGEDIIKEHFAPVSQLLFLLFLYEKDSYSKLEAAKRLHVSPMAISRASKQLLEKGLITEKKQGTEIVMTVSVKDRMALYNKASKYLINPVKSVLYLPNGKVNISMPASGEFSLSQRSDMGYPKYVEYALYKDLQIFEGLVGVDPDLDYGRDNIRIQKWKYDPVIFSSNGQVDPVSLICTFADTRDERIHKCLEQVREEIQKWQTILY
jgi:DNA-binding transcriptional ArsR family regulator